MIIQNPLLTGSLNYNGADLSNVTSSNANSASVSLILTAVSSSNQQLSASYIALSASYNIFSGSASTRITTISASQQDISASLLQVSASYIALSGSYNTFSGSASTRVTKIENNYATTGSNSFRADQSITGSLVVSSTITAQTLVVQTVTSSIVYSSGSNNFGNSLNNAQTFTGSVNITGSLTVNTTGTEFQVTNNGVVMGNLLTDAHSVTGSLRVTGSIASFAGSVGIGVTNPGVALDISGYGRITGVGLNASPYSIGANPNYVRLTNTGGDLYIGQEGSTSGTFFNGSLAYDSVLYSGRAYNFIINGVSRMYVSSSGDVGIGKTNPSAKLEIESARNSTLLRLTAISGENWDFKNTNTVGSTDVLSIGAAGATANLNLVDNGNVGIGTASPYTRFQVNGGNASIQSDSTAATDGAGDVRRAGYGFRHASADLISALINTTAVADWGLNLHFNTRQFNAVMPATPAMTITAGQNVGIGTTGPTNPLHVYGTGANTQTITLESSLSSANAYVVVKSASKMYFSGLSTDLSNSYIIYDGTAGVERMRITSGGTIFNKQYVGSTLTGGYSLIGTISAINVADTYAHVKINTIGSMMYWIKVFGYQYIYGLIEGMSGGYIGGGTGAVQQAFQNGSIVAQYQNNGYLEIVIYSLSTATTNRWGSITLFGGSDTIATVQPLEIIEYSWTSTTTRVY